MLKLFLLLLFAMGPLMSAEKEDFVAFNSEAIKQYESVEELYDKGQIKASPAYVGDYYNFGYWGGIDLSKEITQEERRESERNLYREIAKEMHLTSKDALLEVGCGVGFGTKLILKEFTPGKIVGMDSSKKQVKRALYRNMKTLIENDKLDYQVGSAEKMPFKDAEFTRIFSIEAPKHFQSFEEFAAESQRVLKADGEVYLAAVFASSEEGISVLKSAIPEVYTDVAHLLPVEKVKKILEEKGFKEIKVREIGDQVWPGYAHWVAQVDEQEGWQKNWQTAYEKQLINYYVISAKK
jgi:cyclopropane fatty-acyl-phospholipid synthase-like methyltransferase